MRGLFSIVAASTAALVCAATTYWVREPFDEQR